jgi:hypothetical protein
VRILFFLLLLQSAQAFRPWGRLHARSHGRAPSSRRSKELLMLNIPRAATCAPVIVTGGNRGIGFEICRQLACQGRPVLLTSRDSYSGLTCFVLSQTTCPAPGQRWMYKLHKNLRCPSLVPAARLSPISPNILSDYFISPSCPLPGRRALKLLEEECRNKGWFQSVHYHQLDVTEKGEGRVHDPARGLIEEQAGAKATPRVLLLLLLSPAHLAISRRRRSHVFSCGRFPLRCHSLPTTCLYNEQGSVCFF